jgi:rare lipoprotein A
MLALGEAAAEPRAGAPIVFARKEPVAQTVSFTVGAPVRPPAPVRMAPATPRPQPLPAATADASDVLYGYGGRRTAVRAAIDLRGALAVSASAEPLPVDAFDDASEAGAPAPEATATQRPHAPAGAPPRPDWLEQERTGAPYQAMGQWYVPAAEPNYAETGEASWYGAEFQGRRTASGEVFDSEALTAAHPTLPIPSLVQVTNLENGREVIVRINDRGPFHGGRLIDVSRRTAEALGFERKGSARVHVRYLGPAPKRVNADGSEAPSQTAPAVAAPPAAAPSTVTAQGAYVVQIGAFSDPANVARARTKLQTAGEVLVDSRGGSLQRVRVGAWNSREDAEAVRAQVASLGYRDAVVTLR